MKRYHFFVLFLSLLWAACQPEEIIEVPVTPFVPTKAVAAFQESGSAYTFEFSVPWSVFDFEAKAESAIGFEVFVLDDDDGGLAEHRASWHSVKNATEFPVPEDFGTLILREAIMGSEDGEALFVGESVLIDGKAEEVWDNTAAYPTANLWKTATAEEEDLSGTFRALWDSVSLYVLIEVTDDNLSVDSWTLNWEDDGVAVYVDPLRAQASALTEGETFLFRMLRNSKTVLQDDFPSPPIWTVSTDDVYDGGPGIDGIPALVNPAMVDPAQAGYLRNNDLVIGYADGSQARAYPHRILDWHEIINDGVNNQLFAITYCPLTGTGIAWDRLVNGIPTTFGVSGLLYNTNLIPYDRQTGSNWSQIRLDCIQGDNQGQKARTLPIIETTWQTWKTMYPNTKVVSLETGFSRNYDVYPYGDYRTNHEALIFPVSHEDNQLPRKTRVHGVLLNRNAYIYPFSRFLGTNPMPMHDQIEDVPIIVVGSEKRNFIVSFRRTLADGTVLSFSRPPSSDPSVVLLDQEGNEWNVLGQAVSGPRVGERLQATDGYTGYWFAFAAFFPELELR